VDPTGEKATVTTTCSTDNQGSTTCNVNVSASIVICAAPGSGLTQQQLNSAAATIQSAIQDGWNGSFRQDGATYDVSIQLSVQVVGNADDAMKSGADNIIGLLNTDVGPGAISGVYLHSGENGPDRGLWNYNRLEETAAHEFGHLVGLGDTDFGFGIMNHSLGMPFSSSADRRMAFGGLVSTWTGNYDTEAGDNGGMVQRGGRPIMAPGSAPHTVYAPSHDFHFHPWWK
jgi:hypothetical protein